jgi:hypothetical protein
LNKFGPQDDGSFVISPRAAQKFQQALMWLGWSEQKNALSSQSSAKNLRECSRLMHEEFGFEHEEYT